MESTQREPALGRVSLHAMLVGIGSPELELVGKVRAQSMNEASVYTIERDAWSIERQRDLHFRLTYERVFLPVQNLWRDFLIHCEEIGSAVPN